MFSHCEKICFRAVSRAPAPHAHARERGLAGREACASVRVRGFESLGAGIFGVVGVVGFSGFFVKTRGAASGPAFLFR